MAHRLMALLVVAMMLTLTSSGVSTSLPAPVIAWFDDVMGKLVSYPLDEPDINHISVAREQALVRQAHAESTLPVAMTFATANCTVKPAYLHGVNVYVDDFYPAFTWWKGDVVHDTMQQVAHCLPKMRRYGIAYWLNLQAFGPGVQDSDPLDRWRCLTRTELDSMVRLAKAHGVTAVLFWTQRVACPALVPEIDRLVRSGS